MVLLVPIYVPYKTGLFLVVRENQERKHVGPWTNIWRFLVILAEMEARGGVKGLYYIQWPSAVGPPEHHRKAQGQV